MNFKRDLEEADNWETVGERRDVQVLHVLWIPCAKCVYVCAVCLHGVLCMYIVFKCVQCEWVDDV